MKCKKKKEIKAIIFDLGGVLMGGESTPELRKKNAGGVHEAIADKLDILTDTWYDAIDTSYAKSIEGLIDGRTVVKTISENLNIPEKKLIDLISKIYRKLLKKNKELYKIAYGLRKKGYIIGILSDQWYLSKKALMSPEDVTGFNPIVVSCDVGLRKPNPKIYRLLLKRLKGINKSIKASEVVFIDNRDWNTEPAEKIGFKVILFKDNKQCLTELKKLGVK